MMKKKRVRKVLASLLVLSSFGTLPIFANSAEARSMAEDMTDLNTDHWAYKAIKELINKYQIMSGFPDGTFRGSRTFTRYEASAALYKVMLKVEEMILMNSRGVQPNNVGVVSNDELQLLKALNEEFRRELDAMKAADAGEAEKLKNLEDQLKAVKEDIGKFRFGGYFETGLEDTLEDTFRPGYSAYYGFSMRAAIHQDATFRAGFGGSFSSEQEEKEEGGVPTKIDKESAAMSFGSAWVDYNPKDVFLQPNVKFGYMSLGGLVSADTSISYYFPGSTGLASPDLNSRNRNRGVRISKSITGGVRLGSGPFSFTVAANPNIFAAQAMLDFDFFKLKFAADADQTLFVGEIVQDPIHNEALILDVGTETIGASVQANFRGIADVWQWAAASGLLRANLWGFEIGGSGKYENESTQQVVIGGFLKTPDKIGDLQIPSILFAAQEPLTIVNGTLFEGSKLGDKAGWRLEVSYDNPVLPNLTFYFDQKTNYLFFYDEPVIANTYGLLTSFGF